MRTPRAWAGILLCATVIGVCGGCDSTSTPAVPTDCTFTVTMTSFTTTPSPAQGMRYELFFSSSVLVPAAAVYLVDGVSMLSPRLVQSGVIYTRSHPDHTGALLDQLVHFEHPNLLATRD